MGVRMGDFGRPVLEFHSATCFPTTEPTPDFGGSLRKNGHKWIGRMVGLRAVQTCYQVNRSRSVVISSVSSELNDDVPF